MATVTPDSTPSFPLTLIEAPDMTTFHVATTGSDRR